MRYWMITVLMLVASNIAYANEDAPLNVLILYADDWRFDSLSCAGNSVVQTPNIDALARDGVRFTNNYVTTSICGVSRASLLTGQWMSRHGNKAFDAFKTPWSETYPGILRASGYYVGHIGKWHNGAFPKQNFDVGIAYSGTHWIKRTDQSPIHVTQKNEDDALAFLKQRPANKPFCLTLAFFAAHAEDGAPEQYLPQPQSLSLYQDVVVPTPKTATEMHFRRLPSFLSNDKNEGRNRWKWRFDTPERYQHYMKNYYRLIHEVDTACGRVVDQLRRENLLDSTLIIFTTDNGYFHGEHGLADKWYPYEESVRVPLIIRDPRMPLARRGTTQSAMTLNVDLAPTILNATQQQVPKGMQGTDLAPLYLADQVSNWRDEFYYEHAIIRDKSFIPASEALIRTDWKYIHWPDFDVEQLFDLANDPAEENDLVDHEEHQGKLSELRSRFRELKTKTTAP